MTAPFDRAVLAAIETAALDAVNGARQTFHYRFSTAGGPCLRALCFEARGVATPMPNLKQALAAACGTAVGEVMEAGALKLGWKTQEYVELPDCDVLVSGHLDCADQDTVVDWKVVKDKRLKRLARYGADFRYVMQASSYASASGRSEWALAYLRGTSIFDDGPDLEWKIISGKADATLSRAMAKIWETVDAHTKAGTLPPIPPGFAPDRFPCGWKTGGCAHRKECYG